MNNSQKALVYAAARYRITEDGRLYNSKGVELIPKISRFGYPHLSVRIRREGITQKVTVHRIVAYQLFGDEVFVNSMVVRHRDCNKLNFRPDNIAIGNGLDNYNDNTSAIKAVMVMSYRKAATTLRRFTDLEVENIRKEYASGELGYGRLAKKYGCSKSTIGGIVLRKFYNMEAVF